MALQVCYSKCAPDDHSRRNAIYLDQDFYELIFRNCLANRSRYAVLSAIASLRYKSPILVVANDEFATLVQELGYLEDEGLSHSQLAELRQVCENANSDGSNLSISGDMYPEL